MSTLDTVRWALTPSQWGAEVPVGWTESLHHHQRRSGSQQEDAQSKMLEHDKSGLRVGGSADEPLWLECSLPRVLYGSNGVLLRWADMPGAVAKVRSLLAAVVPGGALSDVTRQDLVLHLPILPADAILALRGVIHPKVRRQGREFFGSGLEWPGDKVHIRLYDKQLEQDGIPGKISRLECQMRGRKTMPCAWDGAGFDPEILHATYRRLVLGFAPRRVPKPRTLAEFLGWLDASNVVVNGLRPIEIYLMTRGDRQRRRLRALIAAARNSLEYVGIDWDAFVPVGRCPDLIDCLPIDDQVMAVA